MRDILPDVERWQGRGDRVAVATVVATRKSAPRPVGSKLAVSETGELAGSVSGGCVESEVVEAANEVLGGGEPRLLTFGISDDLALSVGLPCGGEIDVWVDEPAAERVAQVAEITRADGRAVVLTDLEDGSVRTLLQGDDAAGDEPAAERVAQVAEITRADGRAVVLTDLEDGSVRTLLQGDDAAGDELIRGGHGRVLELAGRRVFADVYGPPPRLLVYGAVDTADALSAAARAIGWHTIVADARARFATEERLPNAHEILVAWPEETLRQVQPDHATAIVVLTHDDKFDIPMLTGSLATEAFYIGALGSRKNQERRRELLLDAGVDEAALERISGPAGLDIGAHTPAETALSMLAEIMAVRAGRDGGRLKDAAGRIHAEVG